jgi:hypothetical protein
MRIGEELSPMVGVLAQMKRETSASIDDASDFDCRAMALISSLGDSCVLHQHPDWR